MSDPQYKRVSRGPLRRTLLLQKKIIMKKALDILLAMEKTGQPARFSFLFFLLIKTQLFLSQVLRIIKQKQCEVKCPYNGKHNSVHGLLPCSWLHNNFF